MQPISLLFQSRKFWVMLLDLVISMILYFGAKYFTAEMDDVKFLIGALQPVALMLIYAIAKEDAAAKANLQLSPPAQAQFSQDRPDFSAKK